MKNSKPIEKFSLKTNDFDELCESAEGWDQQYYQLSPGTFQGSIELTRVGSTQIMRERWGRKIRYRGTTPSGLYGFALPLNLSGPANCIGHAVSEDSIVIQAPHLEADLIGSDDWDALVLGLPEETVRSIVSNLSSATNLGVYHAEVTTLTPSNALALRRVGMELVKLSEPSTAEEQQYAETLTDQFVKLFLWEIVSVRDIEKNEVGHTKPAEVVRQATDFVMSNPCADIGLTDICAKLNVSLRTLHYVFETVTGISPATWLRRIRLNRVHKTLVKSSPDDILVKQVALDNGFLHLGHFTRQYRHFFGCLPSQTLRTV